MIVLQNGVVAQVILSDFKKGDYLSISFGQAMGVLCAIYVGGGVSVS
jgi:glycerol uptake facilitator-like aquaporin